MRTHLRYLIPIFTIFYIAACAPIDLQPTPPPPLDVLQPLDILATEVPTKFPNPTALTGSVFSTALALSPAPAETQEPLQAPGAACIPNNPRVQADFIEVIDGETFVVQINGRIVSIRFIGLDAPELQSPTQSGEYYGQEAAEKNRELLEGETITLVMDISTSDGYGQLLDYVVVDDIFINYELVRLGYAKSVAYPPDVSCSETLAKAEEEARAAGLGIWEVR
jgi:micrococcal nuclease